MFVIPSTITPDKITTVNGVMLKEYLMSDHNPNGLTIPAMKTKKEIKWIAVHNTADLANVDDDGRNYVAATLNDNLNGVIASVYVDDLCAWQLLEWERKNWCSSDSYDLEGANNRGISLEIIMDGTGSEADIKARDNGARLAAWLLHENGLDISHLITHTYCLNKKLGLTGDIDYMNTHIDNRAGKVCPVYIIPKWKEFKALVQKYLDDLDKPVELYRVRKLWSLSKSQIGAYKNLESAKKLADFNKGYKVYNSDGKKVYTPAQYYYNAMTITNNVPVKLSPKYMAKTQMRFSKEKRITVFEGKNRIAENGIIWAKFTSDETAAFPAGYAWIPLKYIERA